VDIPLLRKDQVNVSKMDTITKLAWIALPAFAGYGMLSQVSSQGTGTNTGGKTTLNSGSAREAKIRWGEFPKGPNGSVLIEDFEGGLEGRWTVSGITPPPEGSLIADWVKMNQDNAAKPAAMIKGAEGRHFVWTRGGNKGAATGSVTSEPFTLSTPRITALVAGRKSPETVFEVLLGNTVIASATGNDSINFERVSLDVSKYKGNTVRLRIRDDGSAEGINYLMVDDIRGEGAGVAISSGGTKRTSPVIDFNNLPYQQTVTQMADRWRSQYNLPGVWCAYIRGGRVVACVAVGSSALDPLKNATVNQHLNVGSVSKVVTNTILARFIAKGQISYDTSVGDTFPEYRNKYPNSSLLNATLKQLITHTAGLPKNVAEDYNMSGSAYRLDVLQKALKITQGRPGSSESYSNVGPVIAVAMAERVVGSSYESWLYGDLGKDIGIQDPHQVNSDNNEVLPFYVEPSGHVSLGRIEEIRSRAFAPQGALSVTLVDLCAFAIYTLDARNQLPYPVGDALLTAPTGLRRTLGGWSAGTQYLFHNGDTGRGEYCEVSINPKTASALIFYTNANSRDGNRFFMQTIGKDLDSLRYLR